MGTASHIPQYQLANQQRQSKLEQSLPPEDTAKNTPSWLQQATAKNTNFERTE